MPDRHTAPPAGERPAWAGARSRAQARRPFGGALCLSAGRRMEEGAGSAVEIDPRRGVIPDPGRDAGRTGSGAGEADAPATMASTSLERPGSAPVRQAGALREGRRCRLSRPQGTRMRRTSGPEVGPSRGRREGRLAGHAPSVHGRGADSHRAGEPAGRGPPRGGGAHQATDPRPTVAAPPSLTPGGPRPPDPTAAPAVPDHLTTDGAAPASATRRASPTAPCWSGWRPP